MFSTEVSGKKTTIYYSNTHFNWQEDIQQTRLLACRSWMTSGHRNLRIFAGAGHVTSQISTQLPASRSPSVTGSAEKK